MELFDHDPDVFDIIDDTLISIVDVTTSRHSVPVFVGRDKHATLCLRLEGLCVAIDEDRSSFPRSAATQTALATTKTTWPLQVTLFEESLPILMEHVGAYLFAALLAFFTTKTRSWIVSTRHVLALFQDDQLVQSDETSS